jgi:hypothetical protein
MDVPSRWKICGFICHGRVFRTGIGGFSAADTCSKRDHRGCNGRLETISFSLQSDVDINEAFLDDREMPGHYVILDNGVEDEHVRRYNVRVVPSRFLIDPDGLIVGRYLGEGLYALQSDLSERLDAAVDGP